MQNEQNMVREFHLAFRHPIAERPQRMPASRVQDRARWLQEEVDEFRAAETLEGQADAMIDLMYFALGTLVEMGLEASPFFKIVHEANMGKLWPDGCPRFGFDGKVQKPPAWKGPEAGVIREVERQVRLASKPCRGGPCESVTQLEKVGPCS